MKPVVSVVSGTYNRLDLLKDMIDSARKAAPVGVPIDFVVCDGGSTDGTLDWLQQQPDATVIEHGELRGAIRAFTDAAYAATGKYVLLANDDVTFAPDSILAALAHLESNPDCGAVAFEDNRPVPGRRRDTYGVQYQAGLTLDGQHTPLVYAQVGLFPKWLGDKVGWWLGDDEQMADAKTYGGDNYLSSRIWELGYKVEPVVGARVRDLVHRDDLRVINNESGEYDSAEFNRHFPRGPQLQTAPRIPNPDKPQLRVLYLPIYEDRTVQRQQKRGLRDALARYFLVHELDYMREPNLRTRLPELVAKWQPDVLLTQLHGADKIDTALLGDLQGTCPKTLIVNWNGDVWPHGLIAPEMLDLLQRVDLQLVVNADVLETYRKADIPAAYWQIGYEEPGDDLPTVKKHDVLFLGNAYSAEREALGRIIREFEGGLYGSGWADADGDCLYDFATGKALYQNCKIAIGDNQFAVGGFVSNRIFQALAAGAFLLHQTVPGLEDLTGLIDGKHYVAWTDYDDLRAKIAHYLDAPKERNKIAKQGRIFVQQKHSFDARVKELFTDLLPKARRRTPRFAMVELRYLGNMQDRQFGVLGPVTRRQYQHMPGQLIAVDRRDADSIVQGGGFEVVG